LLKAIISSRKAGSFDYLHSRQGDRAIMQGQGVLVVAGFVGATEVAGAVGVAGVVAVFGVTVTSTLNFLPLPFSTSRAVLSTFFPVIFISVLSFLSFLSLP